MIEMDEKNIRGEICHTIYQHEKASSKYMKDYDKSKEGSYLKYWNVKNLYGWGMSQKLPVNIFQWIEDTNQFNEDFIKSYNEESDERYFLEVDIQYPEKLHELNEKIQIERVERLVTNLNDKAEYVIHVRNLK